MWTILFWRFSFSLCPPDAHFAGIVCHRVESFHGEFLPRTLCVEPGPPFAAPLARLAAADSPVPARDLRAGPDPVTGSERAPVLGDEQEDSLLSHRANLGYVLSRSEGIRSGRRPGGSRRRVLRRADPWPVGLSPLLRGPIRAAADGDRQRPESPRPHLQPWIPRPHFPRQLPEIRSPRPQALRSGHLLPRNQRYAPEQLPGPRLP